MNGYVGVFSPERAQEISRTVDQFNQFNQEENKNHKHDPEQWFFVKAKEDIAAADNPETGYTTGVVHPLIYTVPDDKDMEVVLTVEAELTVTNRLPVAISEGDYFWCRIIEAELVPFIATSSGGARIMFFRIREIDCDYTGDWFVEPTFISDCSPIPDEREDGLVRVRPSCCESPYTEDELIASGYGTASYVYPVNTCGTNGQWREIVHCADDGCNSGTHEECTR